MRKNLSIAITRKAIDKTAKDIMVVLDGTQFIRLPITVNSCIAKNMSDNQRKAVDRFLYLSVFRIKLRSSLFMLVLPIVIILIHLTNEL